MITPTPISVSAVNLETGRFSKPYYYVLRGQVDAIKFDLYSGVYNKILSEPTPAACIRYNYDTSPCTKEEIGQYYLKYLDDETQKKYLDQLVSSIKSKTSNKDDQARIAISFVQQIPYDYTTFREISSTGSSSDGMRMPYQVIYDNRGVCGEKSLLLAYFLRELGYGVVLFDFNSEQHMAVGVKAPLQYSYRGSGYAFIETARPTIPTDYQREYVGVGKLKTTPDIIKISEGRPFDSISEEYQDANTYNSLVNMGQVLDQYRYYQWLSLDQKYGMSRG
jgi:hypothetical protein